MFDLDHWPIDKKKLFQAEGVLNILMFNIHRAYIIHYLFFPENLIPLRHGKTGYFGQQSFHISPLQFDMFIVSAHGFPQAIHACMLNRFGQFFTQTLLKSIITFSNSYILRRFQWQIHYGVTKHDGTIVSWRNTCSEILMYKHLY